MAPFFISAIQVVIKSIYLNKRYLLGAICIVAAWIFPYSSGGSRDAVQQIFSLGAFSVASIIFGFGILPARIVTVAIAGGLLLSITPNPYWGNIFSGLAGICLMGVAACTGVQLRRSSNGLNWALFGIVAAALLNALEGLLQWFGLVGELYKWVIEPESRGMAFGALRQVNLFATFLCVGVVCTVWLVQRQLLTESMAWVLLVLILFAIAASGSRTGILELGVLAAIALRYRRQLSVATVRLMVGQMMVLGSALIILPVIANALDFHFLSGAIRAAKVGQDTRWLIWWNALDMIRERPWFGWGWHETGYAHYITLFQSRYDGILSNVHNLPLQLAVEFGLVIAIPASLLFLGLIFGLRPPRFDESNVIKKDARYSDRLFAWCVLLLIVGIHSMLEYPLWYAGFLFLTGLFFGYLLPENSWTKSKTYEAWMLRSVKCITLSLLILAYLAWQQYAQVLPVYQTPFTNKKDVQRAAINSALENASSSWLFREHLDYVKINSIAVTPENAQEARVLAEELLHFSAEPKVIRPLLSSLWYLKDFNSLYFHAERFCRAFPSDYKKWTEDNSDIIRYLESNRSSLKECAPRGRL